MIPQLSKVITDICQKGVKKLEWAKALFVKQKEMLLNVIQYMIKLRII